MLASSSNTGSSASLKEESAPVQESPHLDITFRVTVRSPFSPVESVEVPAHVPALAVEHDLLLPGLGGAALPFRVDVPPALPLGLLLLRLIRGQGCVPVPPVEVRAPPGTHYSVVDPEAAQEAHQAHQANQAGHALEASVRQRRCASW